MKRLASYFLPKLPIYLVYMLQQVEYEPNAFLAWLARVPQLTRVMHRQKLVWTRRARLLTGFSYGVAIVFLLRVALATLANPLAVLFIIFTPLVAITTLYIIVLGAWVVIEQPRRRRLIAQSEKIFASHPATKIAIAGSYGKTSMKELLLAALKADKKVAATPGNKNVPISHARWAATLDGDEDILLIEYGEGAPGDVKCFAATTHPDIGIITGLAPNHLDRYGSLEVVAKDLFSLADYLKDENVYVNVESTEVTPYLKDTYIMYSQKEVLGWTISGITVSLEGMSFQMKKDTEHMHITSGLLGRHQVGPLSLAAALSHKLGLKVAQIEANLAQTKPYEHRMQPYKLAGATIIDDGYNGSLEGIRAGTALLKALPATRKIYVTPGLVDQGKETERVHLEIGRLIANAKPDQVILMKNSVTDFITEGLEETCYEGTITIQTDPLDFYTNLDQYVAVGDLVILQNDWTDNYH